MQRVSIDDVEPETWDPDERTHDRRPLTEALSTTDVAINHYVLDPGERFSGSMHAHMDQEEVFVVLDGEATFETRDGAVEVAADEAIRFGPGEFQTGYNDGDEPVVALALGAPRESEDLRIARVAELGDVTCPECGHGSGRVEHGGDGPDLRCPECGTAIDMH